MAHHLSFSQSPISLPSSSKPSSKLLHHNTTFSIKPTPISTHLKRSTIFTSISKNPTLHYPRATQDSNSSSETEQNPPSENKKIDAEQVAGGNEDVVGRWVGDKEADEGERTERAGFWAEWLREEIRN
ncbi:hypothetical protein HAX54_031609 [Datura stramonium]|uniref:Uncharacterized protein n=1 Tax=Datura stramonium TaxID=4076 RepID=A0ABS8RL79_DATST|nr:hypothetical protein [Datura stramonium]